MLLHDIILESIIVGKTSYSCSTLSDELKNISAFDGNGECELDRQFKVKYVKIYAIALLATLFIIFMLRIFVKYYVIDIDIDSDRKLLSINLHLSF